MANVHKVVREDRVRRWWTVLLISPKKRVLSPLTWRIQRFEVVDPITGAPKPQDGLQHLVVLIYGGDALGDLFYRRFGTL